MCVCVCISDGMEIRNDSNSRLSSLQSHRIELLAFICVSACLQRLHLYFLLDSLPVVDLPAPPFLPTNTIINARECCPCSTLCRFCEEEKNEIPVLTVTLCDALCLHVFVLVYVGVATVDVFAALFIFISVFMALFCFSIL